MNKRIKEKWLKWLRNPKNHQIQQALKNEYGHCCLGGLCEIHAKEKHKKFDKYNTYLGEEGTLPDKVMKWAELSDTSVPIDKSVLPKKRKYRSIVTLVDLNDIYGFNFKQIANVIEKCL